LGQVGWQAQSGGGSSENAKGDLQAALSVFH